MNFKFGVGDKVISISDKINYIVRDRYNHIKGSFYILESITNKKLWSSYYEPELVKTIEYREDKFRQLLNE